MKKLLIAICILLTFCSVSYGACTQSGRSWTAASASLADVQACITNNASLMHGDTVNIPAGSATWTSQLILTKAIKLKGAGSSGSGTNITAGMAACTIGSTGCYLIYFPYNTTIEDTIIQNHIIEITGFKFDGTSTARGNGFGIISMQNKDYNKPYQIYIHDNYFYRGRNYQDSSGFYVNSISLYGHFKGTISSNTLDPYPAIAHGGSAWAGTLDEWKNPFRYGKYSPSATTPDSDNLFIENNTFTIEQDAYTTHQVIHCNFGSKTVIRYNKMTSNKTNGYTQFVWGHENGPHPVPISIETYGNEYIHTTCGSACADSIMHHSAGPWLAFGNKLKSSVPDTSQDYDYPCTNCGYCTEGYTHYRQYSQLLEQREDTKVTGLTNCPTSVIGAKNEYLYVGDDNCSAGLDGTVNVPNHPWRTYTFQNWFHNGSDTLQGNIPIRIWPHWGECYFDGVSILQPEENYQWWKDSGTCTKDACATGVGCGSDTPSGTCTKGTAFWKTSQSCAGLTDKAVGIDDATPRTATIQGTLYRCTATNTWTAYYAPYQYPHPFRNEPPNPPPADTTAPVVTSYTPTSEVNCADVSSPYTQAVNLGITTSDATAASVVCKWCLGTPTSTTVRSYSTDNHETTAGCNLYASNLYCGQSFTAPSGGASVSSVKVYLSKVPGASPSGNLTLALYDHTGVYGTSSNATGAALGTSAAIAASTVTWNYPTYQLVEFTFSTPVALLSETNYVFRLITSGADTVYNRILGSVDASSPTDDGNYHYASGGTQAGQDMIYYVYYAGVAGCASDTSYGDMGNTMDTTDGINHTDTTAALTCGTTQTIYALCTDGTNVMTSSQAIPVTIGSATDTDKPIITSIGTSKQACAISQTMAIETSKQSTCKWCESGAGCAVDTTYANMANFFQTTAGTMLHHEAAISQACSTSVNRYVRCMSTQNVESDTTTIALTTDAAKGITAGGGSLTVTTGTGSLTITILP